MAGKGVTLKCVKLLGEKWISDLPFSQRFHLRLIINFLTISTFREEEREECRLQLELDLLSFENKDLLEREIEKGGANAKDLSLRGDSDGFQSFVTDAISGGASTENKQEVKDFGSTRIFMSPQESSEGLEQEDTIATNDKVKDVPQAELSNIEVNMREDSSINQSSSDPDVLDPTLLDLLSLNSVPITDPV